MNIMHRVALAGFLVLATGCGLAQGKGQDHGWYVAVDYGESHLENNELSINSVEKDESSVALSIRVGYRFTRRFALDVGYTDIGDFTARFIPYCTPGPRCQPHDLNRSIYGYQVNAIGTWPVARYFHLKGALRGFRREMESSSTDPVYGTSGWHETGSVLGLSIGIAIPINEHFELGFDYTDYRDLWTGTASGLVLPHYEQESSLVTLGLRFNF